MKLHSKSRPCLVTLVVEMNCLCPECDEPNDLLEIGEVHDSGKCILITCGNCKHTFGVHANHEDVLKLIDKLQERIPCTLLSDDAVSACNYRGYVPDEQKDRTGYTTPAWPSTVVLEEEDLV